MRFLKNASFRYAVVELALIVSGILLALGVDSCAGAREERAQEQEALAALREDLTADLTRIQEEIFPEIKLRRDAVAFIRALLPLETMSAEQVDAFVDAVNYAGFFASFQPQRAAIDDLIGSGSLRLLQNGELRRSLLRYYQQQEAWRDYEDWARHTVWYQFRPEVGQYLHPDLMGIRPASSSEVGKDFSAQYLQSHPEFQWGLVNVDSQAAWQHNQLQSVVVEIERLIAMMDDAD